MITQTIENNFKLDSEINLLLSKCNQVAHE